MIIKYKMECKFLDFISVIIKLSFTMNTWMKSEQDNHVEQR